MNGQSTEYCGTVGVEYVQYVPLPLFLSQFEGATDNPHNDPVTCESPMIEVLLAGRFPSDIGLSPIVE